MNCVRLAGTKEQLVEIAHDFEKRFCARVLVLDSYEPNHPEIASALHNLSLFVLVPDPDGLPLGKTTLASVNTVYRALKIFKNPERQNSALRTLNAAALALSCRTSSSLHNCQAALEALNIYHVRRGCWPKSMLEVGFGDDPTGQRLACSTRGTKFYGVTTDRRPTETQHRETEKLIRRFGLEKISCGGSVWYETRLEDLQTDLRFDLICSFAVYEHVDTPKEFTAATLRLLEPNGLLVHQINNVAHGYGSEEHSLLELSMEEFEALKAKNFSVRHRMLIDEYEEMFNAFGLKVETINLQRSEVPQVLVDRYAPHDPGKRSALMICEKTTPSPDPVQALARD